MLEKNDELKRQIARRSALGGFARLFLLLFSMKRSFAGAIKVTRFAADYDHGDALVE